MCLVHVIEHFNSPVSALRAIHALVRPGGRLYVECPNLAAPFAACNRLFHFAHVYNFTPWTLLAVARKCGFELEHRFTDNEAPNVEMLLRRIEAWLFGGSTAGLPANHQPDVSVQHAQLPLAIVLLKAADDEGPRVSS